jgi:hypothetical protein
MSLVLDISASLNCDPTALGQIYTVQQTQRSAAETYVVQLAGSEVQVALCIFLVAAREADKQ